MQIFKLEDTEHYDYSNITYFFINEYGYLKFYQMGSFDLAFTVHKFDAEHNAVSFNIEKDSYPKVYDLITNMLNEIEKLKYLRGTNRIIEEYYSLYEKGYFSWKSDAPANECSSNEEFIYNYFNIHKDNNSYVFEFVCNENQPFFTVEVNTDRSRYDILRFPVWNLFNKLDNVCEKIDNLDKVRDNIKSYHIQRVNKKE